MPNELPFQQTKDPIPGVGSALWVGIALVALVTVLRGLVLYWTPMQLFFDEAQYWSWGTNLDFGYFSKPPLLAWIIRGFSEICGNGEACIRLGAPVLYGLTALVCGALAARFVSRMGGSSKAAFVWATLLFVTLPGVTFAARLISTDAPLLLCFALALLFLDRLRQEATFANAIGLGIAVGFGFMAKYAMIYFIVCSVLWMIVSREGRRVLLRPIMLIAVVAAFVIVVPNILWNAVNDWITFQHTGDNANWQGFSLHFDNMAEFIGAQIGIIGPVLFVILLIGCWSLRQKFSGDVKFLLSFSLPIIGLMIVQATIARAHANWAAVAFIALSVLAVSWAVSWRAKPLLVLAAVIHVGALLLMSAADLHADRLVQERVGYPYKRVFGWKELSHQVKELADAEGVHVLVADRRSMTAQLLYYLRNSDLIVRTWPSKDGPANYYEMAIPLASEDKGPLLVLASCSPGGQALFIEALPPISVPVRPRFGLTVYPYIAPTSDINRDDVC